MPMSLDFRENQGFAETYPRNPKVVSDMTSLHHINEPAILYNLGERAKLKNQRPYTFMVSWYQGAMIVRIIINNSCTGKVVDCGILSMLGGRGGL